MHGCCEGSIAPPAQGAEVGEEMYGLGFVAAAVGQELLIGKAGRWPCVHMQAG
jgi:hypothetical protein